MDKKLLEILACPVCKGKIIYRRAEKELVCKADRLAFAIEDDIPIMLVDEARELSLDELDKIKGK